MVIADVDLQGRVRWDLVERSQVLVGHPQANQVAACEDHRQLVVRCPANHLAVAHLQVSAVHRTNPDTFCGMLPSVVGHRDSLSCNRYSLVCDHSSSAILLEVLYLT